jgi:hypothetical protein
MTNPLSHHDDKRLAEGASLASVIQQLEESKSQFAATLQQTGQLMHEYSLCLTDLFNTLERARRIRELGTRSVNAGREPGAP